MKLKLHTLSILLIHFFCVVTYTVHSQNIKLDGRVIDVRSGQGIDLVTVYIFQSDIHTETDANGFFSLSFETARELIFIYSRLGYTERRDTLSAFQLTNMRNYSVELSAADSDLAVTITDNRDHRAGMVGEGTEGIRLLPSVSGNLESVLPHIALGARSGTGGELSSQYNVRGGNYDENLVYVNDFEIFRPQLLKSSQQEGLSFPNIDLMRDLYFSSGGYESRYGDKMSSVMDISYKRPEAFKSSLSMSFLGASGHVEGSTQLGKTAYNKLRYLLGLRYKTTRYILGSLDVQGEYTPNFADIQSYITYDISRELQIGLLSNYNYSKYDFKPLSRGTALGLVDFALRLTSVFEGNESDQFKTGMVGTSITFIPEKEDNPLFLKLLFSTYQGLETESHDVTGYYRLSQVETDIGSDNVGEEVALVGVGAQQLYSRNRLFNRITNAEIKGGLELQSEENSNTHFLQWGVKVQNEQIEDRLNEWERLDSAGYSLPFSESAVLLNQVLKSEIKINSLKSTLYIQDSYNISGQDGSNIRINAGIRGGYWNLNKDFTISPRVQLLYNPVSHSNVTYKLGGGIYYQTPFYRELRRPDGSINENIKAQKSFHIVGGISKDFDWKKVGEKPFKLIIEGYYKNLSDLISYDINNVRIRYSGENDANGYAAGLDLRVNGEFVPGAESWVNLSFLRTREQINGVQHQGYDSRTQSTKTVSDVPRPTDQFVHISVFFQDYLPRYENFKVNLNLIFGTGLPFGLPEDNLNFRNVFTYKPYRRVDMGFAYQLWKSEWRAQKTSHPLRSLENAWLSFEVFNLIGIDNVSSNTWIKSVYGEQYAVPNNLTNRRLNLRLRIDF